MPIETVHPNKQVVVDAAKSPVTPIASSMIVSGHLVYLAGAIGEGGRDIKKHTKQAFKQIEDRLSVIGLDLTDLVNVTIFLGFYDEDFPSMNEAYAELFPEDGPLKPCRTCVGVAKLPIGTDIEVQAVRLASALSSLLQDVLTVFARQVAAKRE
ncbi:hypothetical protein JCM8097_000020 [Rhodosporidiobolus ruineniae]